MAHLLSFEHQETQFERGRKMKAYIDNRITSYFYLNISKCHYNPTYTFHMGMHIRRLQITYASNMGVYMCCVSVFECLVFSFN